jgi:hypothetical protein
VYEMQCSAVLTITDLGWTCVAGDSKEFGEVRKLGTSSGMIARSRKRHYCFDI